MQLLNCQRKTMIKAICSRHTKSFPFLSCAALALASVVSMVTKQEALPLVKALGIIIRRYTSCWGRWWP